ncbi:hypothetical protein Q3G72_021544 [Acer saccharum]|nr:hypothetical protein Q3G72_018291 [Acer saccharum]KAK1571698.1 hypothetical protein Q3G72_021544 [Acer saccharum]
MSPEPKPISTTTHHHHHKPKTLPDLFLTTALSLLCLFTSSDKSSNSLKVPSLYLPSNPRRFLKIPTMSLTKDNNHNFAATPQSLSDWLRPRLPSDSFASWGVKPGTKNIHNLWLELSEGETSLADSTPPVRSVNVVTVRIFRNDKILIESLQELSDGNVRDRCRPLSEKMKPDETPEEAVFRAVKEELGSIVSGDVVRIVPGSYLKKVEERDSKSYPGLPARYVLHSVDALVDGLPEEEFCTEEAEEYLDSKVEVDKAVCVRKHHWKWVSPDSIKS